MIPLTGKVFGRLTVIKRVGSSRSQALWRCSCSCGGVINVVGSQLRGGTTKSCGCLRKEAAKKMSLGNTTHGLSRTPTYNTWKGMVERCSDPNCKDYHRYGGKGVTVCVEWLSFDRFFADMGLRPEGMTLDRYPDPSGGYSPLNCRWATSKEQAFNRGTTNVVEFNGVVDSQAGWARRLGISPTCLRKRLKKWPLSRALTEPKLQLIAQEK